MSSRRVRENLGHLYHTNFAAPVLPTLNIEPKKFWNDPQPEYDVIFSDDVNARVGRVRGIDTYEHYRKYV